MSQPSTSSVNLRSAPVLNPGKASYFKKLAITTILGGYQFSDDESGIDLSSSFQGIQIAIYLFFPLVSFVCGMISSSDDFIVSGVIPGIINLVFNMILQLLSQSAHKKVSEDPLLSGESTKQICMLIKAKSRLNMALSVLIMGVLSFFTGNFIAKAPIAVQILTLITSFVTFYSLVSASPSEFSATISDHSNPLNVHSTALMRPFYMLICLIVNISMDTSENQSTFHVLIPLLSLLYALGLLSSVYTTCIYAIEKFNTYILGAAESSATDLRLVLQTAAQVLAIFFIALIAHYSYELTDLRSRVRLIAVISSIVALFLSMNFLFSLTLSTGSTHQKSVKLLYVIANKCTLLAASIILPLVFSIEDDNHSTGRVLCIISLIVVLLNHIFQEGQSAYFSSRFCQLSSVFGKIVSVVSQIVFIATISQISVNSGPTFSQYNFTDYISNSLAHTFIQTALVYRLFRSVYANPLMTGILLSEIMIYSFAWDDSVVQLIVFSPVIHAANIAISNFFRRIVIWIYSILKMNSSKKQTIAKQTLFNILSFTALLPINLLGIVLSSALDTPFLPLLGLPLYFTGFPRPKRFWPDIKRAVRASGESLLYEKFLDSFKKEFASILRKRNAQVGEFFLIRIEKYLATVQILEIGQNYLVIQMRGLESQEMTSCHSIEANQIDRIVEETYMKKMCFFSDCLGSLKPIQQLNVQAYEENQLQFTGVITDSGFVKGYREILLKLITYLVNQTFTLPQDQPLIDALLSTYPDYVIHQNNHKTFYPTEFAKLINFNLHAQKQNNKHDAAIASLKKQTLKPQSDQVTASSKIPPKQQQQFNLNEDFDVFAPKKSAPYQQNQQPVLPSNRQNVIVPSTTTTKAPFKNDISPPQNLDFNKKASQPVIFEQPKPEPAVYQQKKIAVNNDLDDLLDDLSVKSSKAPIKAPLIESPRKPQNQPMVNQPIISTTTNQPAFPVMNSTSTPIINQPAIPVINQTAALTSAANVVSQQPTNQNKNQIEMQQFTIKPKKDSFREDDDIDDYLQSMLNDNQKKEENIPLKKVEDSNNPPRVQVENPVKPKEHIQVQSKQPEQDDLDDFLNDLAKDLDDDDLRRPKVGAPPMKNNANMNLKLEDDVFNNLDALGDNAKRPILNMPKEEPQSNTRITGERSMKDSGYESQKASAADEDKAMKLIYLLFCLCTNDSNCDKTQIDQELLFKHFKDTKYTESIRGIQQAAKVSDVTKLLYVMNRAVRFAIKIAYDQFAYMGSAEDVSSEDIVEAIGENEKECSIGMGTDIERSEAIKKEIPCLWSLHYASSATPLSIFRSQFKEIKCSIFTFDANLVQSIWANLVFELYYATNDDDERYSIQTHEQFFRNLIIQNAEEPLGYAPFYSGPTLLQY